MENKNYKIFKKKEVKGIGASKCYNGKRKMHKCRQVLKKLEKVIKSKKRKLLKKYFFLFSEFEIISLSISFL